MENLDKLLQAEEPAERTKVKAKFGLDELRISRYAYEKAFRYAKLALEIRKASIEVGGFLTVPKDSQDRIAQDAFLARDQEVTYDSYRVSAEDVKKAGKEIDERGQRIIGWWHSHGSAFSTFHSDIDDRNQLVLLNQIAPDNYVVVPQEKNYGLQSRVEGDELVFWDHENESIQFRLKLNEKNAKLAARNLRIIDNKRVGFSYSFVVNCSRWIPKRQPYCEIATRDLCKGCMSAQDTSLQVGYKIFEEGEYRLDDDELVAELKDRVLTFNQNKKGKKYFLPETFEAQRAAGTLARPNLPVSSVVYDTSPRIIDTPRKTKLPKGSIPATHETFPGFLDTPRRTFPRDSFYLGLDQEEKDEL